METQEVIVMREANARKPKWQLPRPVSFTLHRGEHVAVVGRNGSGKTKFVDMLTGRHPVGPDTISYDFGPDAPELVSDCIRYITFRDTYGGDNDRTYFLQQRWNQMEIDEEMPTVGSKLEEAFLMPADDTPGRRQLQRHLYELFHLGDLLDKYIILLSSGELRKYKLAAALFGNPRLLVIDNPFIGLDAPTREQLQQLLATLASEQHLQLVLVLSRRSEVPAFVNRVVEMGADGPVASFDPAAMAALVPPAPAAEEPTAGPVISMQDVTIRYGARTILSHLDWQVRQGEHWALQGQNGSGKSTLLSLVCADNPQAYACDIALFGHRRGSGESIWDVKRRIGYVSPEMHRSYRQNLPAIRVVASGLKDSIGLYVKPNEAERELCRRWMQVFGLQGFDERPFLSLSSGEQRLVLLARAFVKSPDLLILDEPLHGLDDANRQLVKQVIESYCSRRDKTLIMVTHYDDELPPCIDHRLFLKRN